jgi:predicted acetyltransferase
LLHHDQPAILFDGMAITLRWVDQSELDRVAETRTSCYAPSLSDLDAFKQKLRDDKRPGVFLLAERDGMAVGTATSHSLNIWVRGGKIPCQGVAWVGTIKTHRRRRNEKGIASQLMHETLRQARERGDVVSALMPFRTSFYEHFGYGVVERRNEWTLPLSILPQGDFDGVRFMREGDLPLMQTCRQNMVERGQCDIERPTAGWEAYFAAYPQGYFIVDQPQPGGPIASYLHLIEVNQNGKRIARIADAAWDSHDALMRQLHFLASLKDQFSAVVLTLPADLPLNWLITERQLPHWPDRPMQHACASMQTMTRMQVRILDHARFLQALKLPSDVSGKASLAIRECEGNLSAIEIHCDAGHLTVKSHSGASDVECSDTTWAAIACGDLRAGVAARLGLIKTPQPQALKLLDALSIGPTPFSNEYF